jgi:argininosuccinate synthase
LVFARAQKAFDEAQQDVSGTVRVKLYKGACTVVGRRSDRSLYRLDMATFEEDETYRQRDAEGFIRLNGLRLAIRAQRRKVKGRSPARP